MFLVICLLFGLVIVLSLVSQKNNESFPGQHLDLVLEHHPLNQEKRVKYNIKSNSTILVSLNIKHLLPEQPIGLLFWTDQKKNKTILKSPCIWISQDLLILGVIEKKQTDVVKTYNIPVNLSLGNNFISLKMMKDKCIVRVNNDDSHYCIFDDRINYYSNLVVGDRTYYSGKNKVSILYSDQLLNRANRILKNTVNKKQTNTKKYTIKKIITNKNTNNLNNNRQKCESAFNSNLGQMVYNHQPLSIIDNNVEFSQPLNNNSGLINNNIKFQPLDNNVDLSNFEHIIIKKS